MHARIHALSSDAAHQGEWPTKYAGEGPEGFNAFHGSIMTDELCRCASGGLVWGIVGGLGIGLPPVLHFGSPALQDKVAPGCLAGEKFICLAITEPYAGSDVAAIRTTAVKDASGKNYIVNGEKKWCACLALAALARRLGVVLAAACVSVCG